MTFIGKTILRVDERPTDPEYGGEDHGTLIVYFTDGTAMKIEGHSYEPVDLDTESLSAEDVRRRNAAVQGQREQERLKRLRRAEWLSVSCDERKRRRDADRAKQSPTALLMNDQYMGVYSDMILAANRQVYGVTPTVRLPCQRCGERACENALTKTYEAPTTPWAGSMVAIPIARGAGQ